MLNTKTQYYFLYLSKYFIKRDDFFFCLWTDVVDWIVNNLIDNTRTRRGVLKKLRDMYLLTDYKGPSKSSKIPQTWGIEEETQLRELYEQFKDSIGVFSLRNCQIIFSKIYISLCRSTGLYYGSIGYKAAKESFDWEAPPDGTS